MDQVVEQLGTAAVIDPARRIVAVAPAAERLLGRPAAVVYGQDLHDLCHRDLGGTRIAPERCPLLQAPAEGRPARGDNDRGLRDDGRLVPIAWPATPLTQDGVSQGMAVLTVETAEDGHARTDHAERAERGEHTERTERAERAARTTALESLAERLALVAEITEVLGRILEVDEALARLSRLLIPRLAGWAAVDLRVGSRQVHRVAVTGPDGRDAGQEDWHGRLPLPAGDTASSPLVQVLSGGVPVLQDRADMEALPDPLLAAVHSAFLSATGASSVVTVPPGTGLQVTGALTRLPRVPKWPRTSTCEAIEGELTCADIGNGYFTPPRDQARSWLAPW
ncbi:PAS domain-containing protein [Streptomyces anandii]|uniref:PAS domain-containing protein n=1 Tax=Streptomyces anandii TaxID=285454 RepID=UPI0037B85618